MSFSLFRNPLFPLYLLTILLSFVLHQFIVLPRTKPHFSHLSAYVTISSLLVANDLLLSFVYESISNVFMVGLLLSDGVLTGALLALMLQIYAYWWCALHVFVTGAVVFAAERARLNAFRRHTLLTRSRAEVVVLLVQLVHALYGFSNGLRTYMHRTVALTGMCLSLYMILFEQFNIEFEIPMPMIIMHFVQSIRSFFLCSLVICVRNRTAYW